MGRDLGRAFGVLCLDGDPRLSSVALKLGLRQEPGLSRQGCGLWCPLQPQRGQGWNPAVWRFCPSWGPRDRGWSDGGGEALGGQPLPQPEGRRFCLFSQAFWRSGQMAEAGAGARLGGVGFAFARLPVPFFFCFRFFSIISNVQPAAALCGRKPSSSQ